MILGQQNKLLQFDRKQHQCKNFQVHIKPNSIRQVCKTHLKCNQRLFCFQCGHIHFNQHPAHNVDQSQEIEEFLEDIQEQYTYLKSEKFVDDQEQKIEEFIYNIHQMFNAFAQNVQERIKFMLQDYLHQVNNFYDYYQKKTVDTNFMEQFKGKNIVDLTSDQLGSIIDFFRNSNGHSDWIEMIEQQNISVNNQLKKMEEQIYLNDINQLFEDQYCKDKMEVQTFLKNITLNKQYEDTKFQQNQGKVTKDSFNFSKDSQKIYKVDSYAQNNKLYIYKDLEEMLKQIQDGEDNTPQILKDVKFNGTYWTVFNNHLFAAKHPRDDKTIFKYDLQTHEIIERVLKDREFGNNTDQLQLANDQIFLSDEDSVYLISQQSGESKTMLIEQLNPDTLQSMHWWKCKNFKKNCGAYFLIDKIIYGTSDCKLEGSLVCYSFNLLSGEEIIGQQICAFQNLGKMDTSLHYVGADNQLWTVNNGYLCTYDVNTDRIQH